MVRVCKEKVTLTYSLPLDVKELDQTQAEAFYRQIESNFKGYPPVKLHKFESLRRRGSSIPIEYDMGWPTEYVNKSSTVLYEKLTKSIPHTMTTLRSILMTHQDRWNGYAALMTIIVKYFSNSRSSLATPRLEKISTKEETKRPLRYYHNNSTYYYSSLTLCEFAR